MKDFEPMKRGEWGFPEPVTTPPAQLDDEGDMLTIAWLDGFHRGKEHAATGTERAVCMDIANRQKIGINKYGTTVHANPLVLKEWLQHAYEEALDQAIYLKRAIQELDK